MLYYSRPKKSNIFFGCQFKILMLLKRIQRRQKKMQLIDAEYGIAFDEGEQAASLDKVIRVIKQYEEVIRTQKKIIGLLFKQGCILKSFEEKIFF